MLLNTSIAVDLNHPTGCVCTALQPPSTPTYIVLFPLGDYGVIMACRLTWALWERPSVRSRGGLQVCLMALKTRIPLIGTSACRGLPTRWACWLCRWCGRTTLCTRAPREFVVFPVGVHPFVAISHPHCCPHCYAAWHPSDDAGAIRKVDSVRRVQGKYNLRIVSIQRLSSTVRSDEGQCSAFPKNDFPRVQERNTNAAVFERKPPKTLERVRFIETEFMPREAFSMCSVVFGISYCRRVFGVFCCFTETVCS